MSEESARIEVLEKRVLILEGLFQRMSRDIDLLPATIRRALEEAMPLEEDLRSP